MLLEINIEISFSHIFYKYSKIVYGELIPANVDLPQTCGLSNM